MNGLFDPVIPYLAQDADDYQAMLDLQARTGIHRFLIVGVGSGVRLTGYPSDEPYRQLAETIKAIKEKVEPHGIEVGWWCAPTLKSGKGPHQQIVDITGKASPISNCPLDEGFAGDFARRIKIVAEIARPSMILFEDDYQLNNHPGFKMGCFCPLHLKKFARYAGREYSREELEGLFTEKPLKAVELRRKWAQMTHDTMVELAEKLRRAIDEVAPETRLWLCEPGCTDMEGNLSRDVPLALAGKKTRPAIRIFGTQYGSNDVGREVPANLAHTMYSAQHLPPEFELFHESDTYPHTRYFSSAKLMEAIVSGAVMLGCDSSLFYGGQYLDNQLEDFGYFDMYSRNIKKWRSLQANISDSEFDGVQVLYRPEFDFIRCVQVWDSGSALSGMKAWVRMLGRFGFPYTLKEKKVKMLCRAAVECLNDEEIVAILSEAALLDCGAALQLQKRGFGELLGVKVEEGVMLPAVEEYVLDNAPGVMERGRRIYNSAYAPAGTEEAQYVKMTAEGAEVLTVYRDPEEKPFQPALTRFVNRLGGRVAVMACSVFNESSNLYNYRKKEVLRGVLNWLDGTALPAAILNAPNMWLLFRKNGDAAYMMITNLSPDPTEKLEIAINPEWRDAEVREMDSDGEWMPTEYTYSRNTLTISGESRYLTPRYFRLKRK